MNTLLDNKQVWSGPGLTRLELSAEALRRLFPDAPQVVIDKAAAKGVPRR